MVVMRGAFVSRDVRSKHTWQLNQGQKASCEDEEFGMHVEVGNLRRVRR